MKNSSEKISRISVSSLIIILFIIFNGFEFFHDHSSSKNNDTCSVCVLSNTLSNSLIKYDNVYFINRVIELKYFVSNLSYTNLECKDLNFSRAPPFSGLQ